MVTDARQTAGARISVQPRLGENVRRRRAELGITQAELAAAIGVSRVTANRIEQGLVSPIAETLFAICDALSLENPNELRRSNDV